MQSLKVIMFYSVLLILFGIFAVHGTTYPAEDTRYNEHQGQGQTPDIPSISKHFTASIARERELNRTISLQQREFVRTLEVIHERFSQREKELNRTMEQLNIHFETREKELNRTWHVQLELQHKMFEGREKVLNETIHNKIEQCQNIAMEWNKTTQILKQDLRTQREEFKRTLELQQQMAYVRELEFNKTIEIQRQNSLKHESNLNKTIEELGLRLTARDQEINRTSGEIRYLDRSLSNVLQQLDNLTIAEQHRTLLMEADLKNLSSELTGVKQACQVTPSADPNSDAVAFYAMLTKTMGDIRVGQSIIFDKVVTNVGNDYNPSTDVFTCQQPGIYVFFLNVMTHSGKYVEAKVVKNGVMLMMTFANGGSHHDNGSNLGIVTLKPGDTVWTRVNWHDKSDNGDIIYPKWTTFSGFMLQSL